MTDEKGWLQVLREQQEKILAFTSTVGLVAGAVKALLSKSAPPVLWLVVFSVLLLAAGIWMLLRRQASATQPGSSAPRYSQRQLRLAWILGTLVVALAWGVVFRERVLYSATLSLLSNRPRVLVSPALAWQVLAYRDATGREHTNTIAGDVASLLEGTPYRVVVVETRGHEASERDAFMLEGIDEGPGLVVSATMVLTRGRVVRLIDQLVGKKDDSDSSHPRNQMLTPTSRFLRNPFLASQFKIGVPLPASANADLRSLLFRLVTRAAVATTLYYDGEDGAGRAYDEILSLGQLLPTTENQSLADVYRGAAYYYATQGARFGKAIAALDLVQRLSPGDRTVVPAKVFLLLADGQTGEAGSLLRSLTPDPNDPAALATLQGEFEFAAEHFDTAIQAFSAAVKLEREHSYEGFLHANIALAYGRSGTISDGVRSRQMVSHLEDAIALQPNMAVYHIMQGYAWALGQDANQSQRAFSRAYRLIGTDDASIHNLYAYWLGRSLLYLERSPEALDTLARLVGSGDDQKDPSLLLIFAQNLLQIPGKEQKAEQYLDRALELEPDLAKAHRFKGIALARRIGAAQGDSVLRDSLNSEARMHLLQAMRIEEQPASAYTLLGALYEQAKDTINAEKQYGRACEIDPETQECLFRKAEQSVHSGDIPQARTAFALIARDEPRDRDAALREAIIWYKAGRLVEAERANTRALQIDPNSFTGHDNLAFVLFDLRRYAEALAHWEKALRIQPNDADALAGKAIALQALGQPEAAVVVYVRAVNVDRRYRDCQVMQQEFMWSSAACRSAAPLIKRASRP